MLLGSLTIGGGEMRKIDWYGNGGRCNPDPGTIEAVECGVCGTQMDVTRNLLGPTSWAEAMSGRKHRYDRFMCPNIKEDWHHLINELKNGVYLSEIAKIENRITRADYWRDKRTAAKKIRAILKKYAAR